MVQPLCVCLDKSLSTQPCSTCARRLLVRGQHLESRQQDAERKQESDRREEGCEEMELPCQLQSASATSHSHGWLLCVTQVKTQEDHCAWRAPSPTINLLGSWSLFGRRKAAVF